MFNRVIARSAIATVTLAQAKHQLNIIDGEDDGSDDEHIQLLIDTATELAQKYTGRLFKVGTVEVLAKNYRSWFLSYGEVASITSAVVTSDSSTAGFTFSPISQIFKFDDDFDVTQEVIVTYDAGYTETPKAAVMGILMMVSSMWENREDTVIGMTVADIPLKSTSILDSIKLEWF
jgi:hypothetical protein